MKYILTYPDGTKLNYPTHEGLIEKITDDLAEVEQGIKTNPLEYKIEFHHE